ncbi:uncharacterized protein LOC129589665 [Paramacrobiotus metropolitanus]|uniref:uncharacterized protein LOC129589665 n=1 Tax=Paramacrobiotus metropolitanus TaxID=2943436 RepID=UPI0024462CC3|nr:uncharacterized protein LOC129589665 [Paramacrobiotus metropolitanus]
MGKLTVIVSCLIGFVLLISGCTALQCYGTLATLNCGPSEVCYKYRTSSTMGGVVTKGCMYTTNAMGCSMSGTTEMCYCNRELCNAAATRKIQLAWLLTLLIGVLSMTKSWS